MSGCHRVAITLEQLWHSVPGGTARAALDGVEALRRHTDLELVGVAARHSAPPAPSWRPSVPVRHLPLPRLALYESWHRLRRPAVERATGPVDVIHATGMAVPPRSAPLVVTVHDLAFRRDPSQFTRRGVSFFTRAIELARREADIVICPSRSTLEDCVADGFDPDRLRLVPWGIDVAPADAAAIDEVRVRLGLPGRYVLWAGTIEPRKNLPVLLDAFAQVDTDAVLVLAGPRGWNEDLTDRLGRLGERVRTVGFVDPADLRALQAGAEMFCFPSLQEGFGLPVLEAMAQGTAVITSSGTATAEVVGESGLLVDPTDRRALTEAIAMVLDDADRRSAMARAGLERARGRFGLDRTAAALLSAYEDAVR